MALPAHTLTKSIAATPFPSPPSSSFPALPPSSGPSSFQFAAIPTDPKPLKLSSRVASTTRTSVSFFPAFLTSSGNKNAKAIKQELLDAIQPLDRGADASPEDQRRIDQIARKLESVNPTRDPLKSELLNGKWELIYTTSQSILQTQRPKFVRSRTNYQAINVDTLRAQNMESWPFFNQVTADLTPLNSRKVAVKFDVFKIGGLIPVKAPGRARGELEITYLDEDLRYEALVPLMNIIARCFDNVLTGQIDEYLEEIKGTCSS